MQITCEKLPVTSEKLPVKYIEAFMINDTQQMKSKPSDDDDDDDGDDEDRGWAWMVLLSSFMISTLIWGQVISFNVYFVVLRDVYHESRSAIAWIGSLNQAMVSLTAITAGFYLNKLGVRGATQTGAVIASVGYLASCYSNSVLSFYFTYGIIVGLGFSLSFSGCLAAVGHYFKRHLFMATSLCITGGGVGMVCFGHLLEYLKGVYGWRGSLLLQSAITLNICAFGATFFPKKKPSISNSNNNCPAAIEVFVPMTARQRLTDVRFVIMMFNGLFGGFTLMAPLVIYKDLTLLKGFITIYEPTLTALSIGNIIGRFAPGIIMKHTQPLLYFVVVQLACSVAVFLLVTVEQPVLFVALSGLFGYGQGNFVSASPNLVSYIFGRREMAVTFGYIRFWSGIGLLFGAPIAGFIADHTGSYSVYLAVCGCILLLTAILTILLYFCHERPRQKVPCKKTLQYVFRNVGNLFYSTFF